MKREDFMNYLHAMDCIEVRKDKKGYSIVRNEKNGKGSGVPESDPLTHVSVCLACKNLEIEIPPEAASAIPVVEAVKKDIDGKLENGQF